MSEPKKTITINPEFLKLPMRGGRTKKNRQENGEKPNKPIKIRSEKSTVDKTYKRRALNYIRKQQEDKYKRLMKGTEEHRAEPVDSGKTYADEFKNNFDDSLEFLKKLADQEQQKQHVHNATLRQYPSSTNSTLFQTPVLNQVLDQNIPLLMDPFPTTVSNPVSNSLQNPVSNSLPNSLQIPSISLPKPTYGCLKGGKLPTYRTLKAQNMSASVEHPSPPSAQIPQKTPRLSPEQQRAELKQFLKNREEEKLRVERVKQQRSMVKAGKKQKRTTTRTFRVGKSKHYARVGVLIPNKTIRTQVLAKKQQIREMPLEDMRKYLIKKGLIRVGSSCPNDVLRQMYESSMMMCGEIQNHNADNLLYNYLHNGL